MSNSQLRALIIQRNKLLNRIRCDNPNKMNEELLNLEKQISNFNIKSSSEPWQHQRSFLRGLYGKGGLK